MEHRGTTGALGRIAPTRPQPLASEFVEIIVGVGVSRVRDPFGEAESG
jgi:hypothetical protein